MEFEIGERVHLIREKYLGSVNLMAGKCGTVVGATPAWNSYIVQFDEDSFPRNILSIDLEHGCPTEG